MTSAALATLLYAPNDEKSALLADFAARRRAEGVAVDGVVIETLWRDAGTKCGLRLRALGSNATTPLTQPYSDGIVVGRWHLLPEGVAAMTRIVEDAVADRAGLLVIDKFGPLEGRGLGMAPALRQALASSIPLVVAVRQEFGPAWRTFVAEAAPPRMQNLREVPTDGGALDAWWAEAVGADAVGQRVAGQHPVSGEE